MPLQLSEIYIYPIKSLGGIRLSEAQLTQRGLAYDRRWMLIDEQGFLTQREIPKMALLEVSLQADYLEVRSLTGGSSLNVPLTLAPNAVTKPVPIWDDTTTAQWVSEEADQWFSETLDHPCSLVYMPDYSERTQVGKTSGREQFVSFADSYPALLVGQASLDDLNIRLAEPVLMNRFRPNLVFTGGEAYEEDQWYEFSIGDATCWAEKPCARCMVVTIDQSTAERGKEPLTTLTKYRKQGNKVLFGQSILFEPGRIIHKGDMIEIKTRKPNIS
ncbi:MAG: MOSC N-terminal beta barrel domain-containing protein [Tunicatimonas sp.]|uniref:MOSC domain-containing protein n=1 Tax=Tunicatimonas sp. TaxID=1940096 RepID=UPI003C78BC64